MVIKLLRMQELLQQPFESSVISYGNQTSNYQYQYPYSFESSVISYGNQTYSRQFHSSFLFESSVISYGNQTSITFDKRCFSV